MRRICAWCGVVLDGCGPVKPGEVVSHGICKTCSAKMEADAKRKKVDRCDHSVVLLKT